MNNVNDSTRILFIYKLSLCQSGDTEKCQNRIDAIKLKNNEIPPFSFNVDLSTQLGKF
jgi:hypothetical protein